MSQFSPKAIDRFIKAKCYDISHDSAVSCHFSAVVPSMPMPSATTRMNPTWKSCIFPSQILFFFFLKALLVFFVSVPSSIYEKVSLIVFCAGTPACDITVHLVHSPHWKCKVKLNVLHCGMHRFGIICVIIIQYQSNFQYYVSVLFQTQPLFVRSRVRRQWICSPCHSISSGDSLSSRTGSSCLKRFVN